MRFFLKAALLAGLSLNLLVSSAQAGPFGLFTRSIFMKSCNYCNCEKQYNAFTPVGYNPHMHRPMPAAFAPYSGGHHSSGCSTCDQQPINIGPLHPVPIGPDVIPYPN